ncbi:MAG: hypothetical protein LUF85_11975 [Bacteroides sp.]|nr:hypothetical protein [Bacteroides sp.]
MNATRADEKISFIDLDAYLKRISAGYSPNDNNNQQGKEDGCIFLRDPVPQLGDFVRYFSTHGIYRPNPTPSGWLLPGDVRVRFGKTDSETCC